MKKKGYSMIVFTLIMLLSSFHSCNDLQNHPGASEDIKDSKKRGVFICEYEANPNPIKVNDSLTFDIREAWLERKWKYPENYNSTEPTEGYQLIIITGNEIHKGATRTWSIGVNFDRYVRLCGNKCLITNFDKLPISNKEVWKVQKGRNLKEGDEKVILGEFILYKKNNEN